MGLLYKIYIHWLGTVFIIITRPIFGLLEICNAIRIDYMWLLLMMVTCTLEQLGITISLWLTRLNERVIVVALTAPVRNTTTLTAWLPTIIQSGNVSLTMGYWHVCSDGTMDFHISSGTALTCYTCRLHWSRSMQQTIMWWRIDSWTVSSISDLWGRRQQQRACRQTQRLCDNVAYVYCFYAEDDAKIKDCAFGSVGKNRIATQKASRAYRSSIFEI